VATMHDVAALAGVSITTVSHVINETRSVAPATRQRVLDAIDATGYTGNAIARSLVTGGTKSLGVAMPVMANPYFAELIHAIESEASASGYTIVLGDTLDEVETSRVTVRTLHARRVDGVLLTPSPGDSDALEALARAGIPTVLVDRISHKTKLDQVGPENIQSTSALVSHLAGIGHQRIGFISGADWITANEERTLGYRLGLGRAGLRFDSSLVASGGASAESATLALRRLLAMNPRPTAVVTGNCTMTAGVIKEARAHGLRIGVDLAVVGHDETEWSELVDPPLTTMAHPVEDIGRQAVQLLVSRIKDPERAPEICHLAPVLVHRQSCGCHP
jgi:LacI family transcriptional regulator